MQRHLLAYSWLLVVAGFVIGCSSDPTASFSTGPGDPRVVGTWRLAERGFFQDSVYSIRVDTVSYNRDTTFYVTRRYPTTNPQTLTFEADGKLTAEGNEVSYYRPISNYRVDPDALRPDSDTLRLNLFISTNGANVRFQQALRVRQDSMLIIPPCNSCYLKFVRAR
ncbi:hypothetical protein [Fibrisoma limi]|uniref:hypothetical protein n=1 Tax=Fibrisoma limi TaxID=663275 RepID=UPI0011817FB8|nr:hypothetical protein [Fibrisoma limi]